MTHSQNELRRPEPVLPSPPKLVYVKWIDARQESGPYLQHEMSSVMLIESAGILIEQTDECLSLADDRWPDWSEAEQDHSYREIMHIPMECVRDVQFIEFVRGHGVVAYTPTAATV